MTTLSSNARLVTALFKVDAQGRLRRRSAVAAAFEA